MTSSRIFTKYKPLFFCSAGLIFSKRDSVYLLNNSNILELLFTLPNTFLSKLLDRISLLFRLRRSGVISAVCNGDNYFFSHKSKLYHYDISSDKLVQEIRFNRGKGPLQFAVVDNIDGFDDGVYFGEYFENSSLGAVHIYRRSNVATWDIVYTFTANTINHVHALIPDPNNKCVWILTGDFGSSSCIWKARFNFEEVEPVVRGMQNFRSCVAFPVSEGLLYATDTQFERNSIRLLIKKEDEWVSKELFQINGSCIYGCELEEFYVFSTSTEPGEVKKNWLLNVVDCKPGPGIIKNASEIVVCKKNSYECSIVKSVPKDKYPYRLFQFGTIMFPNGENRSNKIFAYYVGSKKNDLSTEVLEID